MKKDYIYNIIAVFLPIAVLQLLVLPIANSRISDVAYGVLLSEIAAINAIPVVMGNSLCNARQLLEGTYRKLGLKGDFQIILLISQLTSGIIIFALSTMYGEGLAGSSFNVLLAALMLQYNYMICAYRTNIDFVGMLQSNIFISLGMIVGLGFFIVFGVWQLPLIIGYGSGVVYTANRTSISSEKVGVTSHFVQALKLDATLLCSLVLSNLVSSGDRLLLFPLMGGAAVSTYYISSLVGKLLVTAIGPLSTVLLSYVVREQALGKRKIVKLLGVTTALGVAFWIVTCLASPIIIGFLYPEEVASTTQFVPIVTVVSIFQAQTSLLNPYLIRFYKAKWQLGINATTLIIYAVSSFFLVSLFGLFGFCLAGIISSGAKLAVSLFAFFAKHEDSDYATLEV